MALDIPEVWGIFHHSGKIHGCRCGFKIMAPANQVHPQIVKGRAWTTYNFSKSKVSHNLINFACHLNWASLWQSRPLIPFGMHVQSLHHSFGQVVAGSGPSIFCRDAIAATNDVWPTDVPRGSRSGAVSLPGTPCWKSHPDVTGCLSAKI